VTKYRYNGGGQVWVKPSIKPSERPVPQPPQAEKKDFCSDPIRRDPLWMIALSWIYARIEKLIVR